MNRGELVQSLVEETGLPKNVVRTVVNALPTVVAKGIREGESISMKGFGSFVPWQQSERLARNPKTGEEVMITPRVSVKFKAGSDKSYYKRALIASLSFSYPGLFNRANIFFL